jgi:hypothetical protein
MNEVDKLREMYKQAFTSDSGVIVLKDLEARSNWRTSSYVAGDANATAFEEGKRMVILHIYNMMQE